MNNEKTEAHRRAGFTLVEMMVVVVIILILLGVVFQMVRPAGDKATRAKTVARLEKLKAALEEFYAEYGQYPPVPYYDNEQPIRYEWPSKTGMRSDLIGTFKDETWGDAPLFTFGLMSFLVTRYEGRAGKTWPTLLENAQWSDHNSSMTGDQSRDAIAIARWAPFLEGATYGDVKPRGSGGRSYTNTFVSAYDGWENDFVYVSPPPHQSYLLFSKGPDNSYDKSDPGNRKLPANKDNVYGDAGF